MNINKIKFKINMLINKFNFFKALIRIFKRYQSLPYRVIKIQESLGRIETRQIKNSSLSEAEFRVFSQFGEDGILQFLINNLDIKNKKFVEFGVQDYQESNTRFLLINNYWDGLIIDSSRKYIHAIKEDNISYASNVEAVCSFITKENINDLLNKNKMNGDIGLLSIDIDGNDYWIWEEINAVKPIIVVIEYNSQFGPYAKVSTPYKSDFVRATNGRHISYYGASISALTYLGIKKGYSLVASNSAGNNLFFVRNDFLNDLKVLAPSQAYRYAFFREAKNYQSNGDISYQNILERYKEMSNYEIFDFESSKVKYIKEIDNLNPLNF